MKRQKKTVERVPALFYVLVGGLAALGLWTVSYFILRWNSSLGLLLLHNSPSYFAWYLLLTVLTSILFGVNVAFLAYQWRKWGIPNIFQQGSSGVGAMLGLVASSCPVCGATFLSMIGVAGGLSSLPFHGLELKTGSLLIIGVSLLYSYIRLRTQKCEDGSCPIEKDDSLKRKRLVFTFLGATFVLFLFVNWRLAKNDSYFFPQTSSTSYACTDESQM